MTFRALVLHEAGGKVSSHIEAVDDDRLPEGEVTVAVEYSTLNYKDGMVLQGQGRLVRAYPHVPGIDFAGTVESSQTPAFQRGDKVVLTGWRVGEMQWGGYAEKARVKADYLVPLPAGLTTRQAMAIGTAGFTAMLAVIALEKHGLGLGSEVLVTGATGGVGGTAIALLSSLGHRVVASTGRVAHKSYLEGLGAAEVIDRTTLSNPPPRPLDRERWDGAIDAVGSATLATILTQLKYRASVAACGLAGGNDLPTTVIPFLLRGVNLLGIDSVMCPREPRIEAWRRLTKDLPLDRLDRMIEEIPLSQVAGLAPRILGGQIRGRTVIDVHR
jgi:acrylyl-CoA reductase (NADPH)